MHLNLDSFEEPLIVISLDVISKPWQWDYSATFERYIPRPFHDYVFISHDCDWSMFIGCCERSTLTMLKLETTMHEELILALTPEEWNHLAERFDAKGNTTTHTQQVLNSIFHYFHKTRIADGRSFKQWLLA